LDASPNLDFDTLSITFSGGGSDTASVENLALEAEGEQKRRNKAWMKSLSWEESRTVVPDCSNCERL
jgi:hypothetical protein